MDFRVVPGRRDELWGHCRDLTELVLAGGGKFYFAKDLTLPPGTPRREFLYVDDLADACVMLLGRDIEGIPDWVNVGSGEEVTIRELGLRYWVERADAVVEKARSSFEEGDYRWVAEVLRHVVFSDTEHWGSLATTGMARGPQARQLVVKYTKLFDLRR